MLLRRLRRFIISYGCLTEADNVSGANGDKKKTKDGLEAIPAAAAVAAQDTICYACGPGPPTLADCQCRRSAVVSPHT